MSLALEASVPRREASETRVRAPAKLNLSLHVVGRREDGYHLLDGLVAFAEECDFLRVSDAAHTAFDAEGPFATNVPLADNSLLRALSLAEDIAAGKGFHLGPLRLVLEKYLPVASGVGGGSADAAALLRHIGLLHPAIAADLRARASMLGADVPMCLEGVPARVTGIGERIEPLPAFPALALVLVNPGVAVETPAVFRALTSSNHPAPPALPEEGFHDPKAVAAYLQACRNDLEEPARRIAPVIGTVIEALDATRPMLTRMSGSGATVFALHETLERAAQAAREIADAHPRWWVRATSTKAFPA